MRVAVIRGDLSKALFLADLELKSLSNPSVEPPAGQSRYLSRPDPNVFTGVLATNAVPGLRSTGSIGLALTINNGNHTLRTRLTNSGGFTVSVIPNGVYATLAALLAAANPVLLAAGVALQIDPVSPSSRVVLTTVLSGVGNYVENDTIGNGSTFNGAANLPDGASWVINSAATIIAAIDPVGGPVDVSSPTVRAQISPALTDAQVKAVADALAPHLVETDAVKKSFLFGNLAGYLSASFCPDPRRFPTPPATGAAIVCLNDDGVTSYNGVAAPVLTNAQTNTPGAGALRLTGTALAPYGSYKVRVSLHGTGAIILTDTQILGAGGSLTNTQINIPASLIPGVAASTTTAYVEVNGMLTNGFVAV